MVTAQSFPLVIFKIFYSEESILWILRHFILLTKNVKSWTCNMLSFCSILETITMWTMHKEKINTFSYWLCHLCGDVYPARWELNMLSTIKGLQGTQNFIQQPKRKMPFLCLCLLPQSTTTQCRYLGKTAKSVWKRRGNAPFKALPIGAAGCTSSLWKQWLDDPLEEHTKWWKERRDYMREKRREKEMIEAPGLRNGTS